LVAPELNPFLSGWSHRLAYSGDRLALGMLKATFNGALLDVPESYLRQVRLPHFGTAEMFAHSYREAKAGREVTHVTLASGEQYALRAGRPGPASESDDGPGSP
jgi:hypothetical protein